MVKMSEQLTDNISILGFKNVKMDDVKSFFEQFRKENQDISVQFFDASTIAGSQHLYFAALNALNAFEKKVNISNNLAVEVLLYASAQRQISKAVEMLGIKQDSSQVATVIISEKENKTTDYIRLVSSALSGERDDNVLELTNEKIGKIKRLFRISETELNAVLKKKGLEKEALTDLVIEHMALLATKS